MMRIVSREAPTLKRHGVRVAIVSPSEGQMDDEFAGAERFARRTGA